MTTTAFVILSEAKDPGAGKNGCRRLSRSFALLRMTRPRAHDPPPTG